MFFVFSGFVKDDTEMGCVGTVQYTMPRIQNTEYRIQNTEYRIQNTEYSNGLCVGKVENTMPPEPKTALRIWTNKEGSSNKTNPSVSVQLLTIDCSSPL